MKTARERAIDCFEVLRLNGDVNLSDGIMKENPQIVGRIISEIERACLRTMEDTLKRVREND